MLDTCLRLASLSDGQEPGKDRQGRYGKEVRERAQERRRLEIVSRDGRNIVTPNVTQLESALEGKI